MTQDRIFHAWLGSVIGILAMMFIGIAFIPVATIVIPLITITAAACIGGIIGWNA